jgi:dienelactone hydrolase
LEPHVQTWGAADDRPRPAVLMFHGCGGIRPHLERYAEAVEAVGCRAILVDSYAPRGWSRAEAVATVCTGMRFWGRERAGDVLATLHGVSRRPDVDASRILLAGWSHGAWSIMDLMTMPLEHPGEAAIADPDPRLLQGVRSLFLAYPYGGYGALTHRRAWLRRPAVFGVVPSRDHVTWGHDSARLYRALTDCELESGRWRARPTPSTSRRACRRCDTTLSS